MERLAGRVPETFDRRDQDSPMPLDHRRLDRSGFPRDQLREGRFGGHQAQRRGGGLPHRVGRGVRRRVGRHRHRLHLFDAGIEGCVEALALVGEPFVEGGSGNARAADDVGDRRRRVGLLGTALDHRVDDAATLRERGYVNRKRWFENVCHGLELPCFGQTDCFNSLRLPATRPANAGGDRPPRSRPTSKYDSSLVSPGIPGGRPRLAASRRILRRAASCRRAVRRCRGPRSAVS